MASSYGATLAGDTLTLTWRRRNILQKAKDRALFAIAQVFFSLAWGAASPFPAHPRFDGIKRLIGRIGILFASFSDYLELKVLDHVFGDGSYTSPTAYLSLLTVIPTDASTGATITEANYTTFARLIINASDMSAAAAGAKTNSAAFTFAACTAGNSTIVGFGILDSITLGAGNMLMWGTVTSKVIDTSNTPPTIAIGALNATLD